MMRVTTLDDICAVIGYRATRMLQSWYGGRWCYLPAEPRGDHVLAHLLGEPALRALCRTFRRAEGLDRLWVPTDVEGRRYDRKVRVARLLVDGMSVRDVARRVELSEQQVDALRGEMMRDRWICYEMEGPRKYRMAAADGGRPRRKILGTNGVFGEPPPVAAAE